MTLPYLKYAYEKSEATSFVTIRQVIQISHFEVNMHLLEAKKLVKWLLVITLVKI